MRFLPFRLYLLYFQLFPELLYIYLFRLICIYININVYLIGVRYSSYYLYRIDLLPPSALNSPFQIL